MSAPAPPDSLVSPGGPPPVCAPPTLYLALNDALYLRTVEVARGDCVELQAARAAADDALVWMDVTSITLRPEEEVLERGQAGQRLITATGLVEGCGYHFRLRVSNTQGSTYGLCTAAPVPVPTAAEATMLHRAWWFGRVRGRSELAR